MSAAISLQPTEEQKRSLKTFANLLKEFPKNPSDGFIYDESTLKKINQACDALHEVTELIRQKSSNLDEDGINKIAGSQKILAQLMDELPREAADEFLYDSTIHRLVEQAREIITMLSDS
jgi:hypothetical protein